MPKAGAYFLYMIDFKKEQEANLGRTLSMADVSGMASDSWNRMSEDEKAYYKEKAKGGEVKIPRKSGANRAKSGGGDGGSGIKTSHGISVSAYEQEERQKKIDEENMRRRISSMIQHVPLMTDFLSHPLYFMFGNYFYKNNDGVYSPAELAMVKFTFHDGVLKKLHAFINPEKVELGYAYTVKAHSESTHRLPPPPNALGEANFGRILYEIQNFMKEDAEAFDGGKQMVFAYADPYSNQDDQLDVLDSFIKQFSGGKPVNFVIYPLRRLFYAIRKELAAQGRTDDVPNEIFCNAFLSKDPYETFGGISCDYHEEKDATRYCALSQVRRWTFIMADFFCEPLGVQLIAGTHLPKNVVVPPLGLSFEGSDVESTSEEEKYQDSESGPIKVSRSRMSAMSAASSDVKSHIDLKPLRARDTTSSNSTLNYEVQSVRTASTLSGRGHGKPRPARAAISSNQGSGHGQPNSSTFYNSN